MLKLETIWKDTLWVVKMVGWREVGTYEEVRHLADSDDCRDFDLCAKQPEHLQEFYDAYWKYNREHGFITVPAYYRQHYAKEE